MKFQSTILTKAALTVATLLAASTSSLSASAQIFPNSYPQYPTSPGIVSESPRNVGGGVTYISSRSIANNIVETTWEYSGTRYTFRSTVDSFYIQNGVESRQARGGEVAALGIAYDEYKRLGYQPGGQVSGGITYISSRPIAENTVEVVWNYAGTRYTYTSRVDSYYIQNTTEARQARGSEREALRIAYDEYRRLGYQPGGQGGSGVTYISSRPIAENTIEVIWTYAGTRYTYSSQLDSFYIRNLVEARPARGGEIEVLRLAYDEYRRLGSGYGQPNNQVGSFTYISSRPVANNTVEVIWSYGGTRYTYQSVIDSYYIRNRRESRPVQGSGERKMLRLAYDEYRRLGSGYGQSGNTSLQLRACQTRVGSEFFGTPLSDIQVYSGVLNSNRTQTVQWTTRTGASGFCNVNAAGNVIEFVTQNYGQNYGNSNRQAEIKQRFERQFLGQNTRNVISELRRQGYQPLDNGRGQVLFTFERSYQVSLNYGFRNYIVESATVSMGNVSPY